MTDQLVKDNERIDDLQPADRTELYQISDRLSYEQGKGTLALHRQAQQPDQPGGGLQGSTLFLLSVQEDPGNDPYPVPGRHQLAVAMDKGDSYEKKDKRIV